MIRKSLTILIMCITVIANAQIPKDYYKGTKGLKGVELKTALYEIIRDHVEFHYTKGSPNTWDLLRKTDSDTITKGNVLLLYTGKSVSPDPQSGKIWNREHVWAKSHGNFGTAKGPGTDVHALRPCNPTVNSARSNYDFAEGGEAFLLKGENTGCKQTSNSWEPRDAVKGDVARMIFYMATRYEGKYGEPDLKIVDYVGSSPNATKPPLHGKLSDLLKWHKQDPVDNMERRRNDTIYKYQKNRNPFIDHPEFADLIYKNLPTSIENYPNIYIIKAYPNPARNFIIVEFNDNLYKKKNLEIQLFDFKGRLKLMHRPDSNMYIMSCGGLPKGYYILKIANNKNVLTQQKIIIE